VVGRVAYSIAGFVSARSSGRSAICPGAAAPIANATSAVAAIARCICVYYPYVRMSPFRSADAAPGILSAVLDASDDSILVFDAAGIVRSWNRAAERLLGFTESEAAGKDVSFIVPADNRDGLAALVDGVRRGDRVGAMETVACAKDGRRIEVSLTASPIRHSSAAPLGATMLVGALTERKGEDEAVLRSELRWRSVIDSAVDGIIVIDETGRVEAFNPGAVRLFGYPEGEVIGQNVSMLMPSPYREEHDGYIGRYLS